MAASVQVAETSIGTDVVHCADWVACSAPTCRTRRSDGEKRLSDRAGQSSVARRRFAVALQIYEAFDTLLPRGEDLSSFRQRDL